jgi:hypothetical protein
MADFFITMYDSTMCQISVEQMHNPWQNMLYLEEFLYKHQLLLGQIRRHMIYDRIFLMLDLWHKNISGRNFLHQCLLAPISRGMIHGRIFL